MIKLNATIFSQNLLILLSFVTLVISPMITTKAELAITPKNSLQEKALFYKAKPGDVIESNISIKNTDQTPVSTSIQANDVSVTEDGSITLLQNSEPNKQLASWLEIVKGVVQVQPNDTISLPLKITIPKDTKSGEYGAGISLTSQKNIDSKATISNTVKKGLKLYVLVQDDTLPILSSTADELQILKLDDPSNEEFQKKIAYWDKNNIVFSFKAKDTGNTFSVLNGSYTLTDKDGKEEKGVFSKNLAPEVGQKEYFVSTNIAYKPGQINLKLDYTIEALNKTDIGETKNENVLGSLSDTINTKSETIKKFRGVEKGGYESNNLEQKYKIMKNLVVIVFAIISFLVLQQQIKKDKNSHKKKHKPIK
jgi:Bacterial protein of unknown function (DUF916)